MLGPCWQRSAHRRCARSALSAAQGRAPPKPCASALAGQREACLSFPAPAHRPQAPAPMAAVVADVLREQGNEAFRSGDFLKAAAAYTRAIKASPDCAVLYRWASL